MFFDKYVNDATDWTTPDTLAALLPLLNHWSSCPWSGTSSGSAFNDLYGSKTIITNALMHERNIIRQKAPSAFTYRLSVFKFVDFVKFEKRPDRHNYCIQSWLIPMWKCSARDHPEWPPVTPWRFVPLFLVYSSLIWHFRIQRRAIAHRFIYTII